MPILFFGDSEGFLDSSLKIVTVGLNPSLSEFPPSAPFSRFPDWDGEDGASGSMDSLPSYLLSLDNYFRREPYRRWFDPSYEPVLRGMSASYYSVERPVLHTDICSPLATDPTWSRLGPERRALGVSGLSLWHDLIDCLQPDIALVSVARMHLNAIRFPRIGDEWTLHVVDRKNPYEVTGRRVLLHSGKSMVVVFGRAANIPMGTVSALEKERIGRSILEAMGER